MRIFSEKFQLLGWLSVILICGFLTTSIAGYVVSRDAVRNSIAEQALPLTADNIYSEIQKDILQPVFISSLMAQDTFVRDWVLGGEKSPGQIMRYLKEVKLKYGTVSSFLVSERTRKYYYAAGILKTVRHGDPIDRWFFRVRAMTMPYETNVDYDMANHNTMTVFINHRVLDYRGNFIGATGVGLTLDAVGTLIDRYQEQFQRRIYFVDPAGMIVLAGKSMQEIHGSIRALPGVGAIADKILSRKDMQNRLEYRRDKSLVLVNSRFIPELGLYLVVEQAENGSIREVERIFAFNLVISAAVSLLVLTIILLAVNRNQRRLEHIAATDALTGLPNRKAFEFIFRQLIAEARRNKLPFSIVLLDIDLFKRINDTCGHLEGDRVIHDIARIIQSALRESDVVARWGGEEFLVMLKDCPLQEANDVAEKLRQAVSSHDFALTPNYGPITISLGVAQYAEDESQTDFFARTDKSLYVAKEKGRNRVEVSRG
ncbi:MAG: sensor domain-containing diguanylate cyclase [Sulfuricella sp.]|nr:sensor domain-containing diguanylate cyclase [Sulfuricella sp.]